MTRPLDFTSEQSRRDWMIENANYFTIIRRANRKNYRVQASTLALAQCMARSMVERYPNVILMIYAVNGASDVWVENVMGTATIPKGSKDDKNPAS